MHREIMKDIIYFIAWAPRLKISFVFFKRRSKRMNFLGEKRTELSSRRILSFNM